MNFSLSINVLTDLLLFCVLLQDRCAFGYYTPPIDTEQNWFLTSAEQNDGVTILQFYRDFITCDDNDRNILVSDKFKAYLVALETEIIMK